MNPCSSPGTMFITTQRTCMAMTCPTYRQARPIQTAVMKLEWMAQEAAAKNLPAWAARHEAEA